MSEKEKDREKRMFILALSIVIEITFWMADSEKLSFWLQCSLLIVKIGYAHLLKKEKKSIFHISF